MAEELAGAYDIIMPDARGHGQSERVARGEKIDQAGDLAAVMRALGIEKAIVGGHSMGASIATALGARFPELVRAIILEDPPWFLPRPELGPAGRPSMKDSPFGKWLYTLNEKTLMQVMDECRLDHPTWPEWYLRPWCQGKMELDLKFFEADNNSGRWQEQVPAIQCPVLFVTADPAQGGIVTPEVACMAKEMNPRLREVNFSGVGHHVRFAVHEPYMRAVKAFLLDVA